jgi:hypothetical protein
MMMGWTRISSLGNTQQLTAGAVGSIVPGPAVMAEFEKMRTEEEEEELPISAGSWAISLCVPATAAHTHELKGGGGGC